MKNKQITERYSRKNKGEFLKRLNQDLDKINLKVLLCFLF